MAHETQPNFFEAYASLLSKAQQITSQLPVNGCSTHLTAYGEPNSMTAGISVFINWGNGCEHSTHPLLLVVQTGNGFTTEAELLADLAVKCEVENPFAEQLATADVLDSEKCIACDGLGALPYHDGFEDCYQCGGVGVVPAHSLQLASAVA